MASAAPKSKAAPSLVPRGSNEGKPAIGLVRPVWVIGSRKGCHLQLTGSLVSQIHTVIVNTGHGLYIKDLASRAHTYINKRQVNEAVLKEGDKVEIGGFKFRFTDPTAKPSDAILAPEEAVLHVSGESMQLPLTSHVTLIGRRSSCDIPLSEESVSTTHAMVFDMDGDHFIRDLGSRTGTFINGKKVHQEALHFGDVIRVGETEITYEAAAQSPAEESPSFDAVPASGALPVDDLADLMSVEPLSSEELSLPLSFSGAAEGGDVSGTSAPMSEPAASVTRSVAPPPSVEPPGAPSTADGADDDSPITADAFDDLIDEIVAPSGAPSAGPMAADDAIRLDTEHEASAAPANSEDTAFNVSHAPTAEKPEQSPEAPVAFRRGWRSTIDPAPAPAQPRPAAPPHTISPQSADAIKSGSPKPAANKAETNEPEATADENELAIDDLLSLAADPLDEVIPADEPELEPPTEWFAPAATPHDAREPANAHEVEAGPIDADDAAAESVAGVHRVESETVVGTSSVETESVVGPHSFETETVLGAHGFVADAVVDAHDVEVEPATELLSSDELTADEELDSLASGTHDEPLTFEQDEAPSVPAVQTPAAESPLTRPIETQEHAPLAENDDQPLAFTLDDLELPEESPDAESPAPPLAFTADDLDSTAESPQAATESAEISELPLPVEPEAEESVPFTLDDIELALSGDAVADSDVSAESSNADHPLAERPIEASATPGELELSAPEETALRLQDSPVAELPAAEPTAGETTAEDVFAGVDIEALALEALEEEPATSSATWDAAANDSAAVLDLSSPAQSPNVSATSDVTLPPEPAEMALTADSDWDPLAALDEAAQPPIEPLTFTDPDASLEELQAADESSENDTSGLTLAQPAASDEAADDEPTEMPLPEVPTEAESALPVEASSLDDLEFAEPELGSFEPDALEPLELSAAIETPLEAGSPEPEAAGELDLSGLETLDSHAPITAAAPVAMEEISLPLTEPAALSFTASDDIAELSLDEVETVSLPADSVEATFDLPSLESPAPAEAAVLQDVTVAGTDEAAATDEFSLPEMAVMDASEPPTATSAAEASGASTLETASEKAVARNKRETATAKASPIEPVADDDADSLPPALVMPVRIKPSTRRRGISTGRGTRANPDETVDVQAPKKSGKRSTAVKVESDDLKKTLAGSLPAATAGIAGSSVVNKAPAETIQSDNAFDAVTGASDEVIEPTEPTPESALTLDHDVASGASSEPTDGNAAEKLSDSVFGRAMEDLAGSALGDLVEPAARQKSPFEQIVSEASSFVAHDEVKTDGDDGLDDLLADELGFTDPIDADAVIDLSDSAIIESAASPAQLPGPAEEEATEQEISAFEVIDPVMSFAGSLTPDSISAVATETIEPLPEMQDVEAMTSLSSDVDWSGQESAVATEEPAPVEWTEPTADAVAGDDVLADASVEAIAAESLPTELETPAPLSEAAPDAPADDGLPPSAPFFGMSRDADAFIGGMPLSLPELSPPPFTFGKVSVQFDDSAKRESHRSPPPPPLVIGEDDSAAPPIAAASAASPGRTIEPQRVPPRPRRPRLADYEKRFADVAEDAALEEMLRSKPIDKPVKEGSVASGFDGLTIAAPVREAEVFSQMPAMNDAAFAAESAKPLDPFLVDKQASIDLAARNIAPGHVPPGSEPNTPAGMDGLNGSAAGDPFSGGDISMAARSSDPFGAMNNLRRSSNSQNPPGAAPNFQYVGSNYSRRKVGLRELLAAMVVCMIGAGLGAYLLTPVSSTLRAKAVFTNLSQRSMFDQVKFHREQENLVNSDTVRERAQDLFKQAMLKINAQSKPDAGVLGDALAFERMTRRLDWPDKSNALVFEMQSVDPNNDRRRLAALLQSMYAENQSLLDVAAKKKKEFEDAQAVIDELNSQYGVLRASIRQIQNNAGDRPSGSVIAEAENQATQLSDVWGQAVAKVKELKAELDRMVLPDENVPGVSALLVPGADPEKDPIVLQMREEFKALRAKIDAAKPQTLDVTEKARKLLDDSLQSFQEQLTAAQAKMRDSPELAAYVAAAVKLQAMTKQLTSDLIDRQRVQNERLTDMKRRLEDQIAARRDELYNNDSQLKELNDKLSFDRRGFNAASSSGLDAEAARFQAEIQTVSDKVDQRKAALGQDPVYAKLTGEIQSIIDANGKALATDQELLQAQMTEVTTALNAALPGIQKLPAEQKALAEGLAKKSSELFDARQAYLSLIGTVKPQDSDDLRKMEADAQLLSVKIDQRLTELTNADRDKKNQSDLEKAALTRKIDETKSALAIAEKGEVDARTNWLAKQTDLNSLREKVNQAKKDDATLEEGNQRRQQLEAKINLALKELDAKRVLGTASILPEAPADDSVTIVDYSDPRWKYAMMCAMSVVGLFTFLILVGGFHRTNVVPVARPAAETVASVHKSAEEDSDDVLTV